MKRRSTTTPTRTLELRISGLTSAGDGIGRDAAGRAVFVPFTAPGDRVRVRVVAAHKRYARARLEELLEPGPDRVEPECAVFGVCGGCAWQHIAYPAQLSAKAGIVTDALERVGGLRLPGPVSIVPSPSAYRYRSRARVHVEAGRVGYRKRGSHALCAIERCPVLVEPLDERVAQTAGAAAAAESDGEWELAWGREGVRVARLAATPGTPTAQGAGRLTLRVAADDIAFSAGVFAQSNAGLLDPLADAVFTAAGRGALALDLFAGAGFFSVGLSRRFERVIAVESNPVAARDLVQNARTAQRGNLEVLRERAEQSLAGALREERPSAIVLDPPRIGLAVGAAEALAALGAPRVVYVSCDPATLARDLAHLTAGGYALERVEAFDLFPQTPHVETVATLGRAQASAACSAARGNRR